MFVSGINFILYDKLHGNNYETQIMDFTISQRMLALDLTPMLQDYTNLSLNQFYSILESNFEYNINTTNCIYWSNEYANFARANNHSYKYITTENHIFIMIYANSSYCIADQLRLNC